MKSKMRYVGIILVMVILVSVCLPVTAMAAGDAIDVSTSAEGYFTVNYSGAEKIKVGVTFDGNTRYLSCVSGDTNVFSFDKGDGTYTVALFRNIGGTSYRQVEKKTVLVELESENAKYLAATTEIAFAADDAVGMKASELCAGLETDEEKVIAMFKYIAENFSYDRELADRVLAGQVVNYVPSTAATLESGKGICYDLSALFAAMCRSQGVPCVITKGYLGEGYHAWNKVMVGESWYLVDMTAAIVRSTDNITSVVDCISQAGVYTSHSDDIETVSAA